MIMLKIAFRNLFRQGRRTVLTALSMIIGFILGAFFIGWADGTYNHIIDNFTRNRLGHIQIHKKGYLEEPSIYKTIDEMKSIKKAINGTDGIESWTPRIFSAGLVSVKEKSAGAQIIGIDPVKESNTTNFKKNVIKGKYFNPIASHEVIIGKGLAKTLKAELGDDIVIVSQAADGSIANDIYKIIGISDTGDDMSNRSAFYLHIKDAQELLVLSGRIHEIAITVNKLKKVRAITTVLDRKIENKEISVEPWQEFARSFYLAMKADKEGMWIMMVVVVLVIAIGVLNTVLMSVLERRREYGVLKAMGTKPSQIFKLVLSEIGILSIVCCIIGVVFGFLLNYYFTQHGIALSEPLTWGGMEIAYLKGEINNRSFTIPALTVILSSILVSIIPALKAAKTEPAKTMRMF